MQTSWSMLHQRSSSACGRRCTWSCAAQRFLTGSRQQVLPAGIHHASWRAAYTMPAGVRWCLPLRPQAAGCANVIRRVAPTGCAAPRLAEGALAWPMRMRCTQACPLALVNAHSAGARTVASHWHRGSLASAAAQGDSCLASDRRHLHRRYAPVRCTHAHTHTHMHTHARTHTRTHTHIHTHTHTHTHTNARTHMHTRVRARTLWLLSGYVVCCLLHDACRLLLASAYAAQASARWRC